MPAKIDVREDKDRMYAGSTWVKARLRVREVRLDRQDSKQSPMVPLHAEKKIDVREVKNRREGRR